MVALQIVPIGRGIAVSTELLGLARVTSGNLPTEKARAEDTPRRDITRASCTPTGASGAMLTVNRVSDAEPSAAITGFAVIFGVENNSALTISRLSPVIVTSTL